MKFGQLTEYNMINIFFENSYTKCCDETSFRLFSQKSNLKQIKATFLEGEKLTLTHNYFRETLHERDQHFQQLFGKQLWKIENCYPRPYF